MHLHIARTGPLQSLDNWREPLAVGIKGVDLAFIVHAGGHGQRLATTTGAIIENLFAFMGTGKIGDDLRTLVLHFEPALLERELGGDIRQAGRACAGWNTNALPGDMRSFRTAVLKRLQNLVTRCLQRVGAQVKGRSLVERLRLGKPTLPEGRFEGRLNPFGNIALDIGLRVGK